MSTQSGDWKPLTIVTLLMLGISALVYADGPRRAAEPERPNTVMYETPTKVCDPRSGQVRTVKGEYTGDRFVVYPSPLASQLCAAAP